MLGQGDVYDVLAELLGKALERVVPAVVVGEAQNRNDNFVTRQVTGAPRVEDGLATAITWKHLDPPRASSRGPGQRTQMCNCA